MHREQGLIRNHLGKVLVAGAINTDLVGVVTRAPAAGETVTGKAFDIFGGGKGANQAVAARRSGGEVTLVGAVGRDAFGDKRLAELSAEQIDVAPVARRSDVASGVAIILVEEGGENRIAYIPGATATVTEDELLDALARTKPAVYLQPNEVPLATARVGLFGAGELGAIRILNATPDPASVPPILEHVDILIVNRGEALALASMDEVPNTGLAGLAQHLALEYDLDLVITGGPEGAFAHREGVSVHVSAPAVKVVDTTGAGDTFCGALAARLALGSDFREAMGWAVTAASLATTVAGAQPSIPRSDAIEKLLRQVGG